jgi:hypothetical protein
MHFFSGALEAPQKTDRRRMENNPTALTNIPLQCKLN